MSAHGTSLGRYLLDQVVGSSGVPPELAALVTQIGYTAKVLSKEFSRAALVGQLGLAGEKNATGDTQKKLDVFANETVVEAFVDARLVSAIVSEELEEAKCVSCDNGAPYLLCIDPLDGSSNVDVNGDVGTIFGIYRRDDANEDLASSFQRAGSDQVGAGYILYGSSTVLVYTLGDGVYGFTLDRGLGEFILSHERVRCPEVGTTYCANVARATEWAPGIRRYLEHRATGQLRGSFRYSGALVADVHRCLLQGGLYFYPADDQNPDGKLRLLYECAPLAFVVEQAGGRGSTGGKDILSIRAGALHQRSPLAIGSAHDVAAFEEFFRKG